MSNYQTLKALIAQSKIRLARDKQNNNTYQYSKEYQHLQQLQKDYTNLLLRLNNK